MKNAQKQLSDIQQMHQAGRLDEACAAYLAWLQQHPDDVVAWHLLGVLFAQQGDGEKAQHYLEEAVKRDPNNPAFKLHFANILRANGFFAKAEQVLVETLASHPSFAAGWNNLGTVYFNQAKWQEAVDAFQSAIRIQANFADAYYNLGLALIKLKEMDAAIKTYEALLLLSPEHPGAQFQLGCLWMQTKQPKKAIQAFLSMHALHPQHLETLINLGACYLLMGMLDEAAACYLKALAIDEKETQALFNLGVIRAEQGHLDEAVLYYKRAIAVNADFYEAHHNVAAIYLLMKKPDLALQHFQEALRLQPTNEAIQHTIHVLTKKEDVTTSPPAYIRSLFDSYANHYDAHLINVLHYDVPRLLMQTLDEAGTQPQGEWDIVDLGCGTGLCGEVLKPMARSLIGVDLSEKMLAVAAGKHIYDELVLADIVSFLKNKQQAFDLMVAGDVFDYFGELAEVFSLLYQSLKPGGLCIFNLEISEKEPYHLMGSGRFAHSKAYVDQLAAKHGLTVLRYRHVPLREQAHEPVFGHLYLLTRSQI